MSPKPDQFTADGQRWQRMRFEGSKVYVPVDAEGRPMAENGRIRIRYRPDDRRVYLASAARIRALDDPDPREAPASPVIRGSGEAADEGGGFPAAVPGEAAVTDEAIIVHTDGACSGNPGPAGIGVLLSYRGSEREISRAIGHSTNNVAELTAVKIALEAIRNPRLPVVLHTDSEYVRGLLVRGWKAKKNVELVDEIRRLMTRFTGLTIRWVHGHDGNEGNERVDRLAREAIRSGEGRDA